MLKNIYFSIEGDDLENSLKKLGLNEEEAKKYKPAVVFMNGDNTIKEITNYESNE